MGIRIEIDADTLFGMAQVEHDSNTDTFNFDLADADEVLHALELTAQEIRQYTRPEWDTVR